MRALLVNVFESPRNLFMRAELLAFSTLQRTLPSVSWRAHMEEGAQRCSIVTDGTDRDYVDEPKLDDDFPSSPCARMC